MTDTMNVNHLRDWIGSSEILTDTVSLEHARAISATLDRDVALQMGDALPPLWHWAFFKPITPTSSIGRDGHPKLGDFLPPIPLPRRMWVGGSLDYHRALRIGDQITRTTTIADVTAKTGRNGDLVFLTLDHEIASGDALLIRETQNIVYRASAEPRTEVPLRKLTKVAISERPEADWRVPLVPNPVLLFRYSALTFNSHRIHYDRSYAQLEEGYPDLVVQGPLTATLLVQRMVSKFGPALKAFSFRAVQPLFCDEPLSLCGREMNDGIELWAETPSGAVAMTGIARY